MKDNNYFHILGVDSNATIGEIKKAYHKLAFKYHPDRNLGKTDRKNFNQITVAYNVLVDPVKKDEYIRGESVAVTDKPWKILNNYWETIYNKGFQQLLLLTPFFL